MVEPSSKRIKLKNNPVSKKIGNATYIGETLDENLTGKGMLSYDTYVDIGEFKNGILINGTKIFNNNTSFKGKFCKESIYWNTFQSKKIKEYEGIFRNGLLDWEGKLKYDGITIEGQFKGCLHPYGKTKITYKSGNIVELDIVKEYIKEQHILLDRSFIFFKHVFPKLKIKEYNIECWSSYEVLMFIMIWLNKKKIELMNLINRNCTGDLVEFGLMNGKQLLKLRIRDKLTEKIYEKRDEIHKEYLKKVKNILDEFLLQDITKIIIQYMD